MYKELFDLIYILAPVIVKYLKVVLQLIGFDQLVGCYEELPAVYSKKTTSTSCLSVSERDPSSVSNFPVKGSLCGVFIYIYCILSHIRKINKHYSERIH